MRIAAIDIGTNSLHMIVVRVRPDLSFEIIDREKEMVRLGAGGLDGRALTPAALGSPIPVDPGVVVVEVRAPGRTPYEARVTVPAEPGTLRVDIPPLTRRDASSGASLF